MKVYNEKPVSNRTPLDESKMFPANLNVMVSDLTPRIETLEGQVETLETDVTTLESDVGDLETASTTNIAKDAEQDERLNSNDFGGWE